MTPPTSQPWIEGVHHDGSALYVSHPLPRAGDPVEIRLRVPLDAPLSAVLLRTEPDGERHDAPMQRAKDAPTLWVGTLTVTMPLNPYSFVLKTEDGQTIYYNALGASRTQWPNLYAFKLIADYAAPDWVHEAVFYQIFPDRFANGDPSLDIPDGTYVRDGKYRARTVPWDTPVVPYSVSGNLDFYGGDLVGIRQRLDYLRELGVTALYLTPIFTSSSNHRYNISSFEQVDPHLGGDAALAALRADLSASDMRLILDVTPNHTGDEHPWFKAAQTDPGTLSAEYYTFYRHPDDYAHWLMARSLPKLNYRSARLRGQIYREPDSVLRRWLRPPFSIDGWRLDVFNMTARQGMFQAQAEVAREMRTAVKADKADLYLLAESFFDATHALQGDQIDAAMNYTGFTMPLWEWLKGESFDAEDFAAQTRQFMAAIPYTIALQQFNLLDSHDTPRIRHIVGGDMRRVRLAAALLMTFPGVPCIYYGDEIGLDGGGDPYNRAPMPWDKTRWDHDLRGWFQRLIALRRSAPALQRGGYQVLMARGGLFAFQRQSAEQRLIIVAYRGPEELRSAAIPVWQAGVSDGVVLRDQLSDLTLPVEGGQIALPALAVGSTLVLAGL